MFERWSGCAARASQRSLWRARAQLAFMGLVSLTALFGLSAQAGAGDPVHAIKSTRAAVVPAVDAPATVPVGTLAPAIALPDADGRELSLTKYAGKVIYLYFWASWSPTCQQDFPVLNALQSRFGAQGLQIVGVAVDLHREDAANFLLDHPAAFPLVFDESSKSPRAYGVAEMPAGVLVGRDGHVLKVLGGVRPDRQSLLESAIRAALPVR